MISDKSDQNSVDQIIAMGYPNNTNYLDELLEWTCDPNWPIAASIYRYFRQLGKSEVQRVLDLAFKVDDDWRYAIIIQIIGSYDRESLELCTKHLKLWAAQAGSQECDFEALRILSENNLIEDAEIAKIAKRNLFVYNMWIKETLEVAQKAINQYPLADHSL